MHVDRLHRAATQPGVRFASAMLVARCGVVQVQEEAEEREEETRAPSARRRSALRCLAGERGSDP